MVHYEGGHMTQSIKAWGKILFKSFFFFGRVAEDLKHCQNLLEIMKAFCLEYIFSMDLYEIRLKSLVDFVCFGN